MFKPYVKLVPVLALLILCSARTSLAGRYRYFSKIDELSSSGRILQMKGVLSEADDNRRVQFTSDPKYLPSPGPCMNLAERARRNQEITFYVIQSHAAEKDGTWVGEFYSCGLEPAKKTPPEARANPYGTKGRNDRFIFASISEINLARGRVSVDGLVYIPGLTYVGPNPYRGSHPYDEVALYRENSPETCLRLAADAMENRELQFSVVARRTMSMLVNDRYIDQGPFTDCSIK